ncbi:MAG: agmatinase [Bacteroidetes bacterium GWE2_41_25]|nr:MAG: agmatinase [Bacteroidetes bacterium GWA2_40_15]OFX83887.1 MAG: agmatinase [Bacteroidetes bacterium GWC2_40_22]OFX99020.1 MAG: agmatinase [Bacteroidetes bacterium GWE2_41_25]OFY58493.1 MAG: agmatinase [Bacteroidetes bacterium GWF2_41_9]HBH83667.1 agmatinase [Bacteroidales bacterium]
MNFGGNEVVYDYNESEIIILPVPYDETSTWMRGADKGPAAILEASVNLEFYDIETSSEAHLKGIHTVDPVLEKETPLKLVNAVYNRTLSLLNDKKFPVIIGGNHTVPIGAIRAFSGHFDNLTILQLDAHADLRQEYEGSEFNHACVMARARECAPIVQVGIRSMSAEELPFADKERMFFSYQLYSDKKLYSRALEMLTENVYITIDLDVFDPSVMPSTGTPEPGGPDYFELMHFLNDVVKNRNVVGFDVVELCPSDSNKSPDFIAAKIIYQLLSYRFGM